jgi:hypothetical protein
VIYEFCRLCLLQPHPHQGMWVGVWVGCIMSHPKLCYFANATSCTVQNTMEDVSPSRRFMNCANSKI